MEDDFILYTDSQIQISQMPPSPENHILRFLEQPVTVHTIPRGCLREYATTPRDKIEQKMRNANGGMVEDAGERGISAEALGFVIAQDYIHEERRYQEEADLAMSIRETSKVDR